MSCLSTACIACVHSYPDSAGKCQPYTTAVANCVMYSSATTCMACDNGYYLSGNSCVAVSDSNCNDVEASAPTVCTECKNNKQFDTTTGKCNDTACGIANCARCSLDSSKKFVCSYCNDGYSRTTTGTCVSEVTANCVATDGTNCSLCKPGYYDSGSTCTKSDLYSYEGSVQNLSMFAVLLVLLSFLF